MTVRVETYYHPKKWREHKFYKPIKEEIHICSTKSMMEGIEECYRDDEKGEFQYVFTVHEVMNGFLKDWHDPERMLQQYLRISKKIQDLPTKENLKSAFRNNRADVMDTIRFLVFCGISPRDMENFELTEKEEFFLAIWKELDDEEDEVYEDVKKFNGTRSDRESIIEELNRIRKDRSTREEKQAPTVSINKSKIILHGFYYITPEQQVFLKFLERSGFEIVFFQFYDQRFPNTFDFIKDFISENYGWTDEWNILENRENNNKMGVEFLKAFEEGQKSEYKSREKIIAYDSFLDFLHQVIIENYPIGEQQKKDDVQIIATNADILNEILIQYYPDRFAERRNFLNYPVGQFILKIHEMRRGNKLYLDDEILMACFSSGWLVDKSTGKNACAYTYELKELLPFFSDCTEISQWKERINFLSHYYNNLLPLFKREKDERALESIRSPFSKIAHLTLDENSVRQVIRFVDLLEEMAENLFDLSSEETTINNHFNRLSELMEQNNPKVYSDPLEEELVKKIRDKISLINDTYKFLYDDISEAIQFYLSGRFDDDQEVFIKPFIEVDGEAFKKDNREIHLTGLDEQGLPLSEFAIPWPLQEDTFKHLASKRKALELHLLRNASVKKISRYLLFIALEHLDNQQLQLSWMRSFLDREGLDSALYIQYMDMEVLDSTALEEDISTEVSPAYVEITASDYNEEALDATLEGLKYEDILAEYQLCPRRFYYGFVLNRYPVFSNDFMHQFIYSELIKVVKRTTKKNEEETIKMAGELFPQWTHYQRYNRGRKNYYRDKEASNTRKRFQFPGLKNDDRYELYLNTHNRKDEIIEEIKNPQLDYSMIMEAKPEHHCRYCPYLNYCKDGQYSIDRRS